MAGQLKVGGNIIASHSGVEGAGTVTLQNATLDSGVVFPANKIINVHSVAKTDNFSTLVENSWVDITGLSVSFTKSSSSKILVMVMLSIGSPNNYQRVFRLNRNGSSIFTNTSTASGLKGTIGQPNEYGGSDRQLSTHPMIYLDTTSATSMTYKVQGFTPSASADHVGFYVNVPYSPDSNSHLAVSSITCFEISQ